MKNVLIIGGSYFVGKTFVEELRNFHEYTVYVMNRGTRPLNLDGVKEIVCDRHDIANMPRVVPPMEWHAVVDFCAYEPGDITTLFNNLPGSVQQYIYISSAAVYQNSLRLPMQEDTPRLTGSMPETCGDYAYKKLLLESELKESYGKKGIAHVSLRPAFIYGKYNYAPRESYFFNLIAQDETIILPSPPQALFSMVSVWDVAKICIACIGNNKVSGNAYTVCAEELVSYDRLMDVLEEITSRKYNIRRQPARMIIASKLPLPFPLEEHLVYSGLLLKEILNYHYMSFLEGMTKTYNWFFKIDDQ